MKLLGASIFCGSGLLVGLALGVWGTSGKRVVPQEQLASRTSSTLQQEILTERDHWKNEAEKFKKWAEEVHQLRGEVSRLNSELAALRQQQTIQSQSPDKSAGPPAASKPPGTDKAMVSFAEAPSTIQAAIIRETGVPAANGIHVSSEKGKTVFGLKGKTEDDRYFALRLDEEGAVLEKHMQIATEAVPPEVGAAVQRSFGDLVINQASEVTEGEQQFYDLSAKTPDEGVQIRVRSDGLLVGYSAKIQPPEARTKK